MTDATPWALSDAGEPQQRVLSDHRGRCGMWWDDEACAEAVADLATLVAVEPPAWLRAAVLEQIRNAATATGDQKA